jgi:hypothetical protein
MGRTGSTSISWRSLKLKKFQLGQVVGLVTRYNGRIEYPTNYWDESGAYFVPTDTHVFWQVKFGLMNKPVFVRTNDMRLATIDEVEELPKLYMRQYQWDDRTRKAISEDSKHWPRDTKGRWVKA